jgi:hypothetical protein
MNQTYIHPAPVVGDLPLVDNPWERNRAYFRQNLPSLLESHRGQFVGIHDGRVVAVAQTFIDTAKAAYAAVGYMPVYIDEVTDSPRPTQRMPSMFHGG